MPDTADRVIRRLHELVDAKVKFSWEEQQGKSMVNKVTMEKKS